ncbi:hypothetical protein QR680_013356 [Steinernema hermaphroditum]|uniref:Cullin family profile domain-containing protein n=1 Tax=Steinernema hermaphroditum TaxID=289476 RepID=A0AA39I589_9BILA|nr:hypothetical protein QR680_013356 [Steinernema hermaphroditum]
MMRRRLIEGLSVDIEKEKRFNEAFTTVLGLPLTRTLHVLTSDVESSRQLTSTFQESHKDAQCDFSFLVLKAAWDLQPERPSTLAPFLAVHQNAFEKMYRNRYRQRKFVWIPNSSYAEVTGSCFSRKFIFVVSASQMALLLRFNERTTYSAYALRHEGQSITEDTTISLNEGFSSEDDRIDLWKKWKGVLPRSASRGGKRTQEADRLLLVEAAIVKIAKSRGRVAHGELLAEVVDRTRRILEPDTSLFKQATEKLIEREFIRRAEGDDAYVYIP